MKIITSNTSRGAYLALAEQLKTTKDARNIVIAPDRFAVAVTRAIMESLDLITMGNIEVVPFSKLGERFIPDQIRKCLTPNGAVMLLSKVLIKLSRDGKLQHYRNVYSKEGFASDLYAAITSLRNSGINPDELENSVKDLPKNMQGKVQDIVTIYNEYIKELSEKFEDSTTILEKVEDYFKNNRDSIAAINFYVTDLYEFTKKEMDALKVIADNALSLTVSLPCGYNNPNRRIYPLAALEQLEETSHGKPEIIDVPDPFIKDYQDVISKYLFSYRYPKDKFKTDHIKLRHAKSRYDEVLRLALDIVQHVHNGGRYKDFEVYISNLDEYEGELKSVFSRYHIPFFIDSKAQFSEQAKVRYIYSAIKCVKSGLARQDVLDFVKNPLFYEDTDGINQNYVFEFENYVLKYNIDYSVFRNSFDICEKNYQAERLDENFAVDPYSLGGDVYVTTSKTEENAMPELVRKVLIERLSPLLDLDIKALDIKVAADACIKILKDAEGSWSKHVKKLENLSLYYVKCSEQVDTKLKEVFEEMRKVLGDVQPDINEFSTIFRSMIESMEIALVPTYSDSVFVGGLESRFMGEKNIYVLGATNSEIPRVPGEGSVLSKDNIKAMKQASINIMPDCSQQLLSNMYMVLDIFKKPMNRLVVSYPDNTSSESRPSTVVTDLSRMFEDLNVEEINFASFGNSDDAKETALAMFSTQDACRHEVLKNKVAREAYGSEKYLYDSAYNALEDKEGLDSLYKVPDRVSTEGINLYKDTTSVSRIERFYNCPYQHYFQYMLSVKPRKEAKLEGTENGTIIHFVLEQFMLLMKENPELTQEEIKKIAYDGFERALDENGFRVLMETPEIKRILVRVKEEGVRLCKSMYDIAKRSKFRPSMLEEQIGKEGELKPLNLDFDDFSIELKGAIDRVDTYNDNFYIIDYKTYKSADLKVEDLYRGTKIQPLLYMRSVELNKNLKPAGVFYLPIYSSFGDSDSPQLKLAGFAPNSKELLVAIDSNAETDYKHSFVDAPKDIDKPIKRGGKYLSTEEFDILGDYAIKVAAKGAKYISEGYIKPTPHSDKSCENCTYFDICGYSGMNFRRTKKVPIEVIKGVDEE